MAVFKVNKVMNEEFEWSSLSINIEICPYDDEEKVTSMLEKLKEQVSRHLKKEMDCHQSSVEN